MNGRALSSTFVSTHRQQCVALVWSVFDSRDGLEHRNGVLNEIAIGANDELCRFEEDLSSGIETFTVGAPGVASSTTAISGLPTIGHAAVIFDFVTLKHELACFSDDVW